MAETDTSYPMTTEDQKNIILSILADKAENDVEGMFEYLDHVGFDLDALSDAKDLPAAWVAHYRLGQGSYDVDAAFLDLLTWPPIARAIFEGQQKQLARKRKQQAKG